MVVAYCREAVFFLNERGCNGWQLLAHRVISRPRSASVAFGRKRTSDGRQDRLAGRE
jgi:hypothetical protein